MSLLISDVPGSCTRWNHTIRECAVRISIKRIFTNFKSTMLLMVEEVQHSLWFPAIPCHHIPPVEILHTEFDATLTDKIHQCDACRMNSFNTSSIMNGIKSSQSLRIRGTLIITENSFSLHQVYISQTLDIGIQW